ncbi:MAG: hypothetical protein ICV66_00890 [Chitinophagaceae bacterium]|nr:hypothetical protein [Chitinophagaceae bacterium]
MAALDLTITEFLILQAVAAILGIAVHFFLKTRRTLKNIIPPDANIETISTQKNFWKDLELKEKELDKLQKRIVELRQQETSLTTPSTKQKDSKGRKAALDDSPSLQEQLDQQQKLLNKILMRLDQPSYGKTDIAQAENEELQAEIKRLESLLDKRENELQKIKQQQAAVEKMTTRLEQVYKEFDALQEKILVLEEQASNANILAIELEEVKQSYDQLKKDLLRKQEKLEETVRENQRLHQLLAETEDKLEEANLQRQQLFKKVQFLEEINTDYQKMSETNKRLQNEIRRIAELESMLSMIQEERDQLLKKRSNE